MVRGRIRSAPRRNHVPPGELQRPPTPGTRSRGVRVNLQRRAGAPRLIDWTGERCVPWAPDVQVVYEHLHRYLWAASLMGGRRVLDLASGEGFGAAILAQSAASVVGVDIDERTVEHSQLNYARPNLEFFLANANDLSRFEDNSFDAVVAFEMIEHVEDQERVLAELGRILAPEGLLVMSTPDRRAYTDATNRHNPFHVRELDLAEFEQLLAASFANTAVWGQRTITGSTLSSLDPSVAEDSAPAQRFFVERAGEEWRSAGELSPLYLIALASNAELPAMPASSTLADCGLELLRAEQRKSAEALREGRLEVEEGKRAIADLERLLAQRDREQAELRQALADRAGELELQLDRAQQSERTVASLEAQLTESVQFNRRVEQSVTWQAFQRARGRVFGLLGGERSRPVRALQAGLRVGARTWRERGRSRVLAAASIGGPAPIVFPVFEQPEVSIVIPLYRRPDLTRACLESIRDRTHVTYEVILVDDDADRETKELLAGVHGARILVNDRNIGYLRSVNLGAARARGRWLALCNNDIVVLDNWLTELLRGARSSTNVAVVTPKYLYPDLHLSEAGAVIWQDGTGGNYGRGDNPGLHQYEYAREVDYGSAAALLVRADFWRDVGGFDERYLPMYYDDADLCFEARERGLRVMYEPRAQVIHVEGATAGVDLDSSHKRYQELNRPKFVEKWRERLETDYLRPDESTPRQAANHRGGPQVLVVDHRVPMWDRDAGSLRTRWIIGTLVDLGCQVTFLPDGFDGGEPYTSSLRRMGVDVMTAPLDMAAEFRAIGPQLALAILSRPHPTSRWLDPVREFAPTAPVVFDTVDLHWLRIARRTALDAGTTGIELGPQARAMRELELGLVRATDVTFVVSEDERARIEEDVPGAVIRVVPTVHELRSSVPPVQSRAGVLFVGGFEHTPNVDAALRLVEQVMPAVWRELGEVPVKIVGACAPPEVEDLASRLVEVAGWVQDVDSMIDAARVLVAPMSYGAGLKGKVTQSLAAGLPVVTTSIGAEGLEAVDGQQLLIADDNDELAERVIRVLRDDELWAQLSRSGQELADARCSPAIMKERLSELLSGDRSPVAPA